MLEKKTLRQSFFPPQNHHLLPHQPSLPPLLSPPLHRLLSTFLLLVIEEPVRKPPLVSPPFKVFCSSNSQRHLSSPVIFTIIPPATHLHRWCRSSSPLPPSAVVNRHRKMELNSGELEVEKHVQYILSVEQKKDSFESVVMEHLRVNGAYWGLTALDIMGKLQTVKQDEIITWVMKCQDESGGFGGNEGHDPHISFTLSAIQVLALFDKLDVLDVDKVSNYISGLQNEDGSFSGDMWGEVDTRFSYIAILALSLLHQSNKINVAKAVEYIVSCQNPDGGLGVTPGGESHSGQIFCCVAALAITGSLHHVDKDLLGWWLCERQVKEGGMNGRPEILPDVCYSWWVLSSLIIIDRIHWIDKQKLTSWILECQDKEEGGISDRPDDAVDVFHTYFGIAGLSLLEYPGLKPIDAAYALPVDVVDRIFFGGKK